MKKREMRRMGKRIEKIEKIDLTEVSNDLDKLMKLIKEAMYRGTPHVKSNKLLFHKHVSDAGWDLESVEDVVIPAKDFASMIHTHVKIDIPQEYFGLVKERSSMASKGIFVMGGVIDSGYRGEIMVNLANVSGYDYVIKSGDRIAQLIILPCSAVMTKGELSKSDRGENGFGSTGR